MDKHTWFLATGGHELAVERLPSGEIKATWGSHYMGSSAEQTLGREVLCLAELSGKLIAPLLDALRVAGDLDSLTIYDLLSDTGIIRREPYDPKVHTREGSFDDSEPGEEIWVLTELGKRFAGKES